MDYEVYLNGKKLLLTDEQIAQIEEVCGSDAQAVLSCKTLQDMNGLNFLVKDYQRGYRWTKSEVQELLEDIEAIDSDENGYCMQPLVVRHLQDRDCILAQRTLSSDGLISYTSSLSEESFELLDGQQRLTTIWLISSFISGSQVGKYGIHYEMIRNVDSHYIEQASKVIKEWFAAKNDYNINLTEKGRPKRGKDFEWKEYAKDKFLEKLNKVFFIWYEVTDQNISSQAVFKSVNEGRIELTNAELFKALLLNPDNADAEKQNKLQQIAFEWDMIESRLGDDDFWYFISQDDSEKTSNGTRIDYVLEIYAREKNKQNYLGLDPDKDRFSFLVVQEMIRNPLIRHDSVAVWEEIVGVYDRLFSWYKDDELYHTIGFLVASEEKNRGSKAVTSEIVAKLYQEARNMTLEETRKLVRRRIREQLIVSSRGKTVSVDDIKYEYLPGEVETVSRSTLKKILLFSNIYPLVFYETTSEDDIAPFIRFPFKLYNQTKAWDIEHITPRTVENNIGNASLSWKEFENCIRSLIDDMGDSIENYSVLEYLDQDHHDNDYMTHPCYDICCKLWNDYANELNQNPDNSICNLVLLNASINRRYGNAFFNRKRKEIIENDQKGVFIPICTNNVFMKYYSETLTSPTQWTEADKKGYRRYIEGMLKEIKGWK